MKTSIHALKKLITGIAFLGGVLSHLHAAPLDTAFTYQGRLADGATPANGLYDLRFTLFDSASGGTPVGTPSVATAGATPVSNGVFTVSLNFGAAFTGQARWLAIEVKTNLAASYNLLTPRIELTPAPHALYASRAGSADGVAAGSVTAAGLAPASVTGATITDGSIGAADLGSVLLNGTFWRLGGNAGTTPGANFLGTTDNQPLELKASSQRVLRIEAGGDGGSDFNLAPDGAPNLIGGSPVNSVAPGVVGATIGGGGATNFDGRPLPNAVLADYATVGGGAGNRVEGGATGAVINGGSDNTNGFQASISTIGGGGGNHIAHDSVGATIGGGLENQVGAFSFRSVIAGGEDNRIGPGTEHFHGAHFTTISGGRNNSVGSYSVASSIGGGLDNSILASHSATIAGGSGNTNSGDFAAIPGGARNLAAGDYSLAAGRRAKASHNGSFVWADDTDADFASTSTKQFAVRADNGVMVQAGTRALDLRGGGTVRVAGAGIGAATPVFIHRATAANINGNTTVIDHPHCNGDPNAILIVTPNWNPGGVGGTYNNNATGVFYHSALNRWAIFNQNILAMPVNAAFNVMVVKP